MPAQVPPTDLGRFGNCLRITGETLQALLQLNVTAEALSTPLTSEWRLGYFTLNDTFVKEEKGPLPLTLTLERTETGFAPQTAGIGFLYILPLDSPSINLDDRVALQAGFLLQESVEVNDRISTCQ